MRIDKTPGKSEFRIKLSPADVIDLAYGRNVSEDGRLWKRKFAVDIIGAYIDIPKSRERKPWWKFW